MWVMEGRWGSGLIATLYRSVRLSSLQLGVRGNRGAGDVEGLQGKGETGDRKRDREYWEGRRLT